MATEDQIAEVLTGEPLTLGYRPLKPVVWMDGVEQPLPFILRDVERMLLHPQVAMCMGHYKAGITQAKWRIRASSSAVGEWAERELRHFWDNCLDQVQLGYDYGWAGYELNWRTKDGLLGVESLHEFLPLDTTVLTLGNRYAGVRVKNVDGGPVDLWGPQPGGKWWSRQAQGAGGRIALPDAVIPPKGFWFTHNRRFNRWYGRTQCYAAWRPWRRLAGLDGAEQVVDTGFYRFAYKGPIVRYPPKDLSPASGTGAPRDKRTARDKARELAENGKAGVSLALPSTKYPPEQGGDYLWSLEWPQSTLSVDGLLPYPEFLHGEIAYGIGIPPELLEASDTGSGWSGRRIPLVAYFVGQQRNARAIIAAWRRQIGMPGARWNFGADAWFEVEVLPLLPPDQQQGQGDAPAQAPAPGGQQDGGWRADPSERSPGRQTNAAGEHRYPGASLSLVRFATPAEQQPQADPWQPYVGKRGRRKGVAGWKNSRTGRVVWGERPKGRPERPKVEDVVKTARAMLEDKKSITVEKIRDLAESMMHMRVEDLQALKRHLGLRAGGPKAQMAGKLLTKILKKPSPGAKRPGQKPPEKKGSPSAKPGEKQPAGVKASPSMDDFAEAYAAIRRKDAGGLVRVPDLYDALKAKTPGLTLPAFHDWLLAQQKADRMVLQVVNNKSAERRASEMIPSSRGLLGYVYFDPAPGKGNDPKPASAGIDKHVEALRQLYDYAGSAPHSTEVEYTESRRKFEQYAQELRKLPLATIRQIGEAMEVPRTKSLGKEQLIGKLIGRATERFDRKARADDFAKSKGEPQPQPPAPSPSPREEELPLAEVIEDDPAEESREPSPAKTWDITRKSHEKIRRANLPIGGIVTVPDLYDAVAEEMPGLTLPQFHRMLKRWADEDKIMLQVHTQRGLHPREDEMIESSRGLLGYVQMN